MSQIDIDWLVRPPEGMTFNAALTCACRGSVTVATVANFFLFEAAKLAKRTGTDKTTVDSIQVICTHDDIIAGIQRLNRTASKKTLIGYIVKLQSWGFVLSDGYHHAYDVYFKKIQEAFSNPPEAEQPKLRGRHAHKTNKEETPQEDCSFNNKVQTTISTILTEKEENRIVILSEEIVNLQSWIVDLRGEIVNLQSWIVNLQSVQSSETASRQALEAKVEALYKVIYKDNKDIYKIEEKGETQSPTSDSDESTLSFSSSSSSQDKNEKTPPPPEKTEEIVTKQAEIPFEELPWGAEKALRIAEKLADTKYKSRDKELIACKNIFKKYKPTEEMFTRVFSKILPYYQSKGKLLHPTDLTANTPRHRVRYEELQEDIQYQDSRKSSLNNQNNQESPKEDENRMVPWIRQPAYNGNALQDWEKFDFMTVKEAKQYGWYKGIVPGEINTKLTINLRKRAAQQQQPA